MFFAPEKVHYYFNTRGRFPSLNVIQEEPEKKPRAAFSLQCYGGLPGEKPSFTSQLLRTVPGKMPQNHLLVFVLGFDKISVV